MIDTIVLMLNSKMFIRFNKDGFYKQTQSMGNRLFAKYVRNPSKAEVKQFGYMPRLTYYTRGFNEQAVKLEFSVPKLLFGNNFDELDDANFDEVINKLKEQLAKINIRIFYKPLQFAPVSSIHYSKNIPLTDYTTPIQILNELRKINIHQRLDMNQTDYREGHGLKIHANSFEIAFYDKLKDLKQAKMSEKRAFEKDNYAQLNLFEKIKVLSPFEVFRMEVRFNQRRKIKQILALLKINAELTFDSLFKKSTSQKVLLYYWQEMMNKYSPIISYKPKSKKDLLAELMVNNPNLSLNKINQIIGAKTSLDEMGAKQYREMTKRFGKTSWYRLNGLLRSIKVSKDYQYQPFKNINKSLSEFKPLKLVDFEDEMLNNDKYDKPIANISTT